MHDIGKMQPVAFPALANIGSLISLETLTQFSVRKQNGFGLRQLGNLNRIPGDLRIDNLENTDQADAIEAKLCDKQHLKSMELVWRGSITLGTDSYLEVIEGLRPNENLDHLSLQYYHATTYPNWLNSIIQNLWSFTLCNCFHLEFLPSGLYSSSSCKELISSTEMLKVLSSSDAFASLKNLYIKECQDETFTFEGLARIPSLEQLAFAECKIKILPNSLKELSNLKYLYFTKCAEIISVPELPKSITMITIEKFPVLKENCRAPDGPEWEKIAHIYD
ncbi:hypothetical protein LUZ60_009789 [Juncus effusus]|nr:hypothetical protein LUZ60_009789 [Juncus effusus]